MKTEKKSERIEVRVGFEEKASFVDACDSQGDTPSGALRRFIRGYVRRADADILSSAWRGLGRRRKTAFVLSGCAISLLAGVSVLLMRPASYIEQTDMDALTQVMSTRVEGPSVIVDPATLPPRLETVVSPTPIPEIDRQTFDRFDRNKSGVLDKNEILPSDHHLHRVLNTDGVPGISRQEFYAKGTMQYRVAKDWVMRKSSQSYQMEHVGRLDVINVSFNLMATPPQINPARPMEETIVETHGRTVLWSDDGAKPHSTWTNDTHPVRD